jgi:hypothetical protein
MACQAFGQCHRRHSIDALSPSQCQTHLLLATSRLLSFPRLHKYGGGGTSSVMAPSQLNLALQTNVN